MCGSQMLGNDQIDTLADCLLGRKAKQRATGAVPASDGSGFVGTDDSVSDVIKNPISQLGPIFHGLLLSDRNSTVCALVPLKDEQRRIATAQCPMPGIT
jgi:hypothetical protein